MGITIMKSAINYQKVKNIKPTTNQNSKRRMGTQAPNATHRPLENWRLPTLAGNAQSPANNNTDTPFTEPVNA